MSKSTDIRPIGVELFFLPVQTRVPLKFGHETLTSVTCARVRLRVQDHRGRTAEGWGETPLSVQWVWPGMLTWHTRHEALKQFCRRLAAAWVDFAFAGHPIEVGQAFQQEVLTALWQRHPPVGGEAMPWLAALVCCSAFDLALHDAFGILHHTPTYATYNADWMNCDLACFIEPAADAAISFAGQYPADFLRFPPRQQLSAWHLVGGLDPLTSADLTGDWIARDGLTCLKVKLRGNDAAWDNRRLVQVGEIALSSGVHWLSADFNCTVTDPAYVNDILDRLMIEHPRIYGLILYVEQPFPYDLEQHRLDVHSVSAHKPLLMDESAHDWRLVRLGRTLGWSGVALKTCKTQTGALLSLCWARAHGMALMVQDLTNPMLAQIPHVLLAAHAGTIMGVETNAMQFYPDASQPEEAIHPGLYRRRGGMIDLSTLRGAGFGGRVAEIGRVLPSSDTSKGRI